MKYIDAEKLIAEIERHLERAIAEQEKFPDMPKYRWYLREGKKELCNDLLDYMYDALGVEEPITDSLQQEQSCDTCTNDKGCVTCKDGELWEGKEQPSDDLEKYASRAGFDYVDDIEQKYPGHRWNDHDVEFAYRDGIIAGAEWQAERLLKGSPMPEDTVIFQKGIEEGKRLMMEDAVKGTVCKDKKCVWIELIPNALPDYEDIEPVKCVVMKED